MRIPWPFPGSIARSRAMPDRSITRAGLSRPFFICGKRSVPPASSFVSAPPLARALTQSSTLSGRTSSNRRTRGLREGSLGQETASRLCCASVHQRPIAKPGQRWCTLAHRPGPIISAESFGSSARNRTEETRMRIGFIGLGNMGGPMALNVLKAGHTMVVTDLRHELAKPHIDLRARWADTAKAVAQASEVVFTSLPGPREVEAVALGAGGVLEGAARGTVYVDLSHELGDVDPSHPCRLCRAWRRRAGRTRQRRRTRRALGQARGAGRRRRGSLQADQARARRDRRQGDVGRRDRLRHRREARAQHGVRMLAHGDRRGHDLGGQGRRGARGAARRPFQELVRPGPRAEGHDPEHRVPRRLRRRELRAQAPAQGRRARHRARPRIPRPDDDRGARRAAARGSAAARLGRQRLDDVLPLAGRARRRRASHEETGGLIMADALSAILESKEAERLATGFVFTEGPLWHPDGFYYFVDIRRSNLHKLTPGKEQELVRSNTGEGNGTTFDLQGRLVICEGGNRRVTRWTGGQSAGLMDRIDGQRL